jgi:butyryl-CoA dehydrogenase
MLLAALSVGALQDLLDRCLEYAQTRTTFTKPIASHQLIADKLVTMRVAIDAGRALAVQAADAVDRNDPDAASIAAIAKLYATDAYCAATREAVQIFGGYGFTDEYPVSRHYRDCKYLEIGGGTSEIQKIVIARSMGIRL